MYEWSSRQLHRVVIAQIKRGELTGAQAGRVLGTFAEASAAGISSIATNGAPSRWRELLARLPFDQALAAFMRFLRGPRLGIPEGGAPGLGTPVIAIGGNDYPFRPFVFDPQDVPPPVGISCCVKDLEYPTYAATFFYPQRTKPINGRQYRWSRVGFHFESEAEFTANIADAGCACYCCKFKHNLARYQFVDASRVPKDIRGAVLKRLGGVAKSHGLQEDRPPYGDRTAPGTGPIAMRPESYGPRTIGIVGEAAARKALRNKKNPALAMAQAVLDKTRKEAGRGARNRSSWQNGCHYWMADSPFIEIFEGMLIVTMHLFQGKIVSPNCDGPTGKKTSDYFGVAMVASWQEPDKQKSPDMYWAFENVQNVDVHAGEEVPALDLFHSITNLKKFVDFRDGKLTGSDIVETLKGGWGAFKKKAGVKK